MSNTQRKNVPELRFPAFEGEWEEKNLGDLTTKIGSGKTPKGGSENYTNKGIPFLRSQNIRNGKLNLNDLVYISKDIDDEMKNSRTYYGDVLLNITGASIGRTAINSIVETHANLNQHVCIIRLKKEYYYIFFGQYLLSRKGKRKIFLAQSGGSREGLNFKEIANLKIFTPTIFEEQQKIGQFFSKLDRQIELEEQKLELLQQQKKGYMQKIFSQELRFKDENSEDYPNWEEKQLGEVADRVIRKNKNLESKKPLTISGQLGLIDQTEYFSKSVSSKNLGNYTLIKNGEFAYNKSYSNGYPLGAIKRLTRYESGLLSSLYICFSIKSEMSKDFMEAYFDSTHWYREVSGIAVEGARNHGLLNISVNDFFNILTKYPSLEEQQKIGSFFSKFDRQIELEQKKIELLQQRKKDLLKSMFI
ncbi:restriction endonuclease subunit S [Staphylococcus aureus]|uniref:restriction endonuclease subunit S n=2 Tax=Staphylococcus aureus TaxID=1280 RepID=UPI000E1BA404|nr:restriction endonuclease subunit S [Staphylococcus aureus]MRW78893.1 restriction endonuclease subunit S [Staphylococcus aureus]NGC30912.1 restriction endonuclease subunit S [Staphylococcus aureus]QKE57030.1 restriction endonuclease subunit S [Staphylococcus aureus]TXO04267.1 restriction endonuclease subunit S [Staphylococcus aureus]